MSINERCAASVAGWWKERVVRAPDGFKFVLRLFRSRLFKLSEGDTKRE